MLIQSLLLIATMLIVGSALLTSTLVSAKAAFHRAVIHKSETAMSDATAQFVTWAQNYVEKYGTEAAWPNSMQPQNGPLSEDLCTGRVVSGNTQPSSPSPGGTCPLAATMEWTVTGSSAALRSAAQTTATSTAQNLSVSLDEQRVSATLTVIIANASGRTIFANHSREVTARIFDASPYVAITGTRDVSTEVGDIHASEGDTAGFRELRNPYVSVGTNNRAPASLSDTRILTAIDCANSAANDNQANPYADGNSVYFDRSRRAYGNVAWVYEAACAPKYSINSTGAPEEYQPAQDNVYLSSAASTKPWQKSDENAGGYSR